MIFFRASTPAPYKNLAYNQTKQTGKAAKSLISKGGSAAAFLRYPPPSNLTTNYQQGPEIPGLVAS